MRVASDYEHEKINSNQKGRYGAGAETPSKRVPLVKDRDSYIFGDHADIGTRKHGATPLRWCRRFEQVSTSAVYN